MQTAKLINIRVIKHLPLGLSVETENGTRGIIRLRELSWSKDQLRTWESSFPVGWHGVAYQMPSKSGQLSEFSLRLANGDPWDGLPKKLEKNQVFEGLVSTVVAYGAFIEIAPGLTGLLHRSQLPAWCKKTPTELFWPGDKVFVIIQHMDADLRQISFSLPPIQQLIEDKVLSTGTISKIIHDGDTGLESLLKADVLRKHILVVEDEIPQAIAVSGWLRRFGQRVDVVSTAEKALDFLEKSQPDIALVDVGLPDMSGTDLARYILEKWPQVQVVTTTDWARADDIMETLESLQINGAKLLLKPLLPEDLITFLLHEQQQQRKSSPIEDISDGKITLINTPKLDTKRSIRALLQKCRRYLDFEQVILFLLDPIHRSVDVVERSGDGLLNKDAFPYLIYSPVRDVAEDHEVVVIDEIGPRNRDRFRYFLEMCPDAVSCIGVPVPTQFPFDYALFAIDKRAKQIVSEQQIYMDGIALAIGASLDQNNLKEKTVLMQRTALIGHLTRAMMHEINNLVGPLLFGSENLKQNILEIEKDPGKLNYDLINNDLDKIQKDIRKIVNTTKIFGRIVAKGKNEILRVDELIGETLGLLRDVSDRAHVKIQFVPLDTLVVVRSQAVVLEQIFLNVMLNAIQQIAELRPDEGGWVKISMELVQGVKNVTLCRILVEDNGPGIHSSFFEKIFEAGFTTRYDGSGIGLYVSRNLIEDVGGKVYVWKSHILSGTLFVIEFPIHL